MNKTNAQRWIGIGALALILPVAAAAQQAFTRGPVDLLAGPSGDYPTVARLGPGQPLDVIGCTNGYGWCDVVLPDELRGWVAAQSLDYAYEDQRVPLATYGASIGIPIVGFAIGNYWANNYRDRSWYGDRRYWGNRQPPPVQGWRPERPPQPGWRPNPFPGGNPGNGFAPGRPGNPNFGGGQHSGNRPQGGNFNPPQQGFRPQPGQGQGGGVQPGFRPPQGGGFPQQPIPGNTVPPRNNPQFQKDGP
ncbi:hypothetical protein BH11PSE13_BH11PSE13_22060 [soil metagenome]